MRRRERRTVKKGAPKWMTTYSDMVTLILVFFVLLFSMSQIDAEKFKAMSEAFRSETIFDALPSIMEAQHPSEKSKVLKEEATNSLEGTNQNAMDGIEQVKEGETEEDPLGQLLAEVESFLNEQELNHVISADRTDQGVVLVLQESVLFKTGEADILDPAKPFLDKVSMLLSNISNEVRVEGHTDNRPISSYRYPSNWELSGARASSVIRYILNTAEFDAGRFRAVGFGDTRPAQANDSQNGWEVNRRVEIVILETGG